MLFIYIYILYLLPLDMFWPLYSALHYCLVLKPLQNYLLCSLGSCLLVRLNLPPHLLSQLNYYYYINIYSLGIPLHHLLMPPLVSGLCMCL